ncbi:hypothetical protein WL74_29415 [Burkholderia cepacia]|nr:hypothetical protein WL74_29415 [Burkholderia cepacia]
MRRIHGLDCDKALVAQMEYRVPPRRYIEPFQASLHVEAQSRNLQLVVVLIRPEPWNFWLGRGPSRYGTGSLTGLLQRVCHAFEPKRAVVSTQWPATDIADGIDALIRRPCAGIDDDPTLARQTGFPRQGIVGLCADTDEHGVTRHLATISKHDGGNLPITASKTLYFWSLQHEFDAHLAMFRLDPTGEQ